MQIQTIEVHMYWKLYTKYQQRLKIKSKTKIIKRINKYLKWRKYWILSNSFQ